MCEAVGGVDGRKKGGAGKRIEIRANQAAAARME